MVGGEDDIKMDQEELCLENLDWIKLIEYVGPWGAVVDVLMNMKGRELLY